MPDVFISYAKPDRTHALDLADELRAHGFSVWIDQGSIPGAKNWSAEIVDAIGACSTLLCLISPNSIRSHNVAREVQLASEKQKHILPVVLEKVVLPSKFEYPLAGLQRVYYEDRPAIFQALELLHGLVATEELSTQIASLPKDDTIRIAVLPFDDLSPEHDNQWFADGMMDELISTLGSLDRVKIPSRSDVLHYRDHHKQSREIARELGVRYLIEGGVRKSNQKIRINASLTDTQPGEQLWTNKFDGTFEDVFAFQELVAKNITDALKLKLTPDEKQKVEEHGTDNAEAYELYLKGRHEQYYLTKESYLRALDLYKQAAMLDPKFVQAHIGVASVCCVYYREYSRDPKWLVRAEASLAKAEVITGETSKSLWIKGMIAWLRGNNDSAIDILTRSGELDPKNHNAFNVLGTIYITEGHYLAAIDAFRRVTEIIESTQGFFNLLTAIRGSEHSPGLKETAERSLPVFDRYVLREPKDYNTAVSRGFILLWAGRKDEAQHIAEQLLEHPDLGGNVLYNLGCLFYELGNSRFYVTLLRRSIDMGYCQIERSEILELMTIENKWNVELQSILHDLDSLIRSEKSSINS